MLATRPIPANLPINVRNPGAVPGFFVNLVAAYCPFLGKNADNWLMDYSGNKRHLSATLGRTKYAGNSLGVGLRIDSDAANGIFTLTGHGAVKQLTQVLVLEARGLSTNSGVAAWPVFRNTNTFTESGTFVNQIIKNTSAGDGVQMTIWTGAAFVTDTITPHPKWGRPVVIGLRYDNGTARQWLDGTPGSTITGGTMTAFGNLSFHGVNSAGEITPYHVIAQYIWKDAKPDGFVEAVSRDFAGPFRARRRPTFFVASGTTYTESGSGGIEYGQQYGSPNVAGAGLHLIEQGVYA